MPLEGEYADSTIDWVRDHVGTWVRTGGVEGPLSLGGTTASMIVVNRGARSGKLHRTPLVRVEHAGSYAAVGSKGGAPKHPGWVYNLRANPQVEVWDGTQKGDFVARELERDQEERATWWQRAVKAFPTYAVYQARAERLIPVFLLEPER